MNKTIAFSALVSHNSEETKQSLKNEYLETLASLSTGLRDVVERLYRLGVTRQELVDWAVAAGYSRGFIRSLLSRIACALGERKRRPGAGRRVPPEALVLLAYARDQYDDRAPKFLLAAYRAAKSQAKKQDPERITTLCVTQ